MTGIYSKMGLGAVMLLVAVSLSAEDNLKEELELCRSIADSGGRLLCYDRIGRPPPAAAPVAAPAVVPEAAAPAVVPEAAAPAVVPEAAAPAVKSATDDAQNEEPPDDFGLPKAEDDPRNTILETIERCGEANDRRFYFYFENGQIWKYLGTKKLRIRDCNRSGRITEDEFGYALRIEGDNRSLRVKRVR